jgi:hypothetical protein
MECYGLDSSGSGQGPVVGSYKHDSERFGSIKCWEILEQLSEWWYFMKDSAPYS